MATKTITIDVAAYERLKAHKRASESFSQAIKRLLGPPFDVDAYLARIAADPMSKQAVRAVEEHVRRRHAASRRRR